MGSDPHNVLSTDAPYSLGFDPVSGSCHHTLAYILACTHLVSGRYMKTAWGPAARLF